jgi:hypothetical protein
MKMAKASPADLDVRAKKNGVSYLYRHFNADQTLLYVGISLSAVYRLSQHRDAGQWFDEIASVTIEKFNTRREALLAERQAIVKENPLYNTHYKKLAQEWQEKAEEEDRVAQAQKKMLRTVVFHPLYTIDEAALQIRVTRGKLKQMISDGEIGCVIISENTRKNNKGIPVLVRKLGITGWQLIDWIDSLEQGQGSNVAD